LRSESSAIWNLLFFSFHRFLEDTEARNDLADRWRESYVGETGKSMKALELFLADSRLQEVICARYESGYEELRLWLPLPFNGQSGLSGVGQG
jgi:hypothetical protein